MTLNGYFMLNSVFTPVGVDLLCVAFKNNGIKQILIDPYCQCQTCSFGTSFWHYDVYADICEGSLDRRCQMTVGLHVNARTAVACTWHS